ncbi:hypothetical protein RchiOBHm_Chr7g0240661 [Rosa chinensis]|uniref:Uncharacterized protein n=1 Tax=Rosa chinensis TaxID=74649 RepID=A0A2P6PI30_ROSCH|nr:hypothetical protein RchiOBHm_Chr7g0240661 [Rosa chinensis]
MMEWASSQVASSPVHWINQVVTALFFSFVRLPYQELALESRSPHHWNQIEAVSVREELNRPLGA